MHSNECATNISERAIPKKVKCVIWDLDNTLWDGILLEDHDVKPRKNISKIIAELDQRGILQSIASRNEPEPALSKLAEFGLDHYFLKPQIGWGAKSNSVQNIVKALNIGADTVVFIDDEVFEREEVSFVLPHVRCLDARDIELITEDEAFNPAYVTATSAVRRELYQAEFMRQEDEISSTLPPEDFLYSLNMVIEIREATSEDLHRAEELTVRTNQLNTTGRTFSMAELDVLRADPNALLLVSELKDRYGPYGVIGLCLVDLSAPVWKIDLLLMSCRVMSRGIGVIMLNYIQRRAVECGHKLQAEFIPNGRNRMMLVTYKFNGFSEIRREGEVQILEADTKYFPTFPDYLMLTLPE